MIPKEQKNPINHVSCGAPAHGKPMMPRDKIDMPHKPCYLSSLTIYDTVKQSMAYGAVVDTHQQSESPPC